MGAGTAMRVGDEVRIYYSMYDERADIVRPDGVVGTALAAVKVARSDSRGGDAFCDCCPLPACAASRTSMQHPASLVASVIMLWNLFRDSKLYMAVSALLYNTRCNSRVKAKAATVSF